MPEEEFFSDRELGRKPLTLNELSDTAWAAIAATFQRMYDNHLFAHNFPTHCDEHTAAVVGTSRPGLLDALRGLIPTFDAWPNTSVNPGTIAAMDLVEFAWRHAGEPIELDYHKWFKHHHLSVDRSAGRESWRTEINLLLRRNELALELGRDGKVRRLGPPAAQLVLDQDLPSCGDEEVDRKLVLAVQKYRNPDGAVRREGLEALWDAFERIKSLLDPDNKKSSVRLLVELMTPSTACRDELDKDFQHLTDIGNQFQIRHFEKRTNPIDEEMVDHLFVRAYSLVGSAVRTLGV